MNDRIKIIFLWSVIAIILMFVFSNFSQRESTSEKLSYSDFITQVKNGNIRTAAFENRTIKGLTQSQRAYSTYMPMLDPSVLQFLVNNNIDVSGQPPEKQSILMQIFISWFPMLLLIGVWIFFMRQMQGGGGRGAMSFGKSRARLLGEDQVKVTFADVAGVEEAKEEVKELVDFLRDPGKYSKLGGRVPQGVLLVGSPGTGKTLLAKAVAGEAKVAFFTISGSDFVEMFVGVGASRVRDMFDQAKKQAPCIIFIDEIDAVGRHRGAGLGGGHDEREQTLNQLLVEMDGFEGNEGIIVMAATNRPDVLDPALLRPGRFDRQVVVSLPDIKGREQILKVHINKVPVEESFEPKVIARGTPGFSGADLANLVNEAALFAARDNKNKVDIKDFERAKDKILMGAERNSMVMTDDEKRLTAYHEAGHAIVGLSVPEHDPVYKVSIIPRGRALGVTMFLPETDRYSHSKQRLESQLSGLYGGRVAEELIFGKEKVTTGASNDIQRATEIARNMVTKWGLSEKLGPLTYGEDDGEVFLGHSVTKTKEVSEETASKIDQEIRVIIDRNYERAVTILQEKLQILHNMAEALIKFETIDEEQIKVIMTGRQPDAPRGWNDESHDNSSDGNTDVSKESNVEDKPPYSEQDFSNQAPQDVSSQTPPSQS